MKYMSSVKFVDTVSEQFALFEAAEKKIKADEKLSEIESLPITLAMKERFLSFSIDERILHFFKLHGNGVCTLSSNRGLRPLRRQGQSERASARP